MIIDEIIGLKLAVSDHRAPNINVDELIRVASDVRTAGMLSGKPGIMCLHMGDDKKGLEPVFQALEETSIPIKTFQPTHCARNKKLMADAFKFAKMGGTFDVTCSQSESKFVQVAGAIKAAKEDGVPMDKMTFSSDGFGSFSNYDEAGRLVSIGVAEVNTMYRQVVYQVKHEGMDLAEALTFATSNVAKALEIYPKKGCVAAGSDADILILNEDLSMNGVIANGVEMMKDGVIIKKGTYEH